MDFWELKTQANNFYNAGNYEKAIESYEQCRKETHGQKEQKETHIKENDVAKVHSNLSSCLYKLKRYEESVVCAKNAIQCNPKFYKGYIRIAEAYSELGEFQKAWYEGGRFIPHWGEWKVIRHRYERRFLIKGYSCASVLLDLGRKWAGIVKYMCTDENPSKENGCLNPEKVENEFKDLSLHQLLHFIFQVFVKKGLYQHHDHRLEDVQQCMKQISSRCIELQQYLSGELIPEDLVNDENLYVACTYGIFTMVWGRLKALESERNEQNGGNEKYNSENTNEEDSLPEDLALVLLHDLTLLGGEEEVELQEQRNFVKQQLNNQDRLMRNKFHF